MQRFTQDGVIYEETGDGQVRVVGYADAPAAPQGGVFSLPQDPAKQAMGAAQLEKLRRDIAQGDQKFAERNVPNGYRLRSDGNGVEPIPGGPNDPSAVQPVNSPKLTAKERADAIAGYTSARHLDDKIRLIEQRFRAGPGATSGIGGLIDYLPTTANQQFDNAGKSARGFVKQALGFTGGENNTARESEFNLGPYIPQSSDRDATVLDKLAQLRDLSQQARERSIGILGGVPDANGKITPYTAPTQAEAPVFDPGQGFKTVATGATKSVVDESKATQVAALQSLLRSGAPDDQIRAVAAGLNASSSSVDAALAFRRKNPGYKGSYNLGDLATRQEATTARERISGSGFGAFTANALNDAAAGIPGAAFGTDNLRAQQAAFPSASSAGSIVGGIAGASGLELGLGAGAARLGGGVLSRVLASPVAADALYGGIQGATTTGTPTGAVVGAGAGVGGGMFGRGATRVAGRALRGVTDTGVRYLSDSGVPLTVGQTLGGVAKGIEDRLSGVPIVGDAIRSRRLEGLREFNRTAFDQGLSNIGASTGGTIGEEGIDLAWGATRQGYRRALDGVSVARDPQFTGEYNAALAQGARVPRVGPEFEAWAQAELDPLVAQTQYTGPIVQDFLQQTRDADFGTDAMGNLVGRSVQGAEDAMRGLVSRQAPDVLPSLQRADQAYRQTQVLRDAVNRARNGSRSGETGIFTPSQLSDAAAANARKFGNTAGTTQQPFFELTRAGQAVLPSQVPDSGTAGRLATLALPGLLGAGGAGAGYAGGDTSTGAYTGLLAGAALTAGGTRGAQRLATRALLDRPDALIRIGNRVYNRAQIGGMFGAGLGASGASLLASDF